MVIAGEMNDPRESDHAFDEEMVLAALASRDPGKIGHTAKGEVTIGHGSEWESGFFLSRERAARAAVRLAHREIADVIITAAPGLGVRIHVRRR